MSDLDDLGGAVEIQAAAGAARHLDQDRSAADRPERMAGQGRLRDVNGAVHHLEAATGRLGAVRRAAVRGE